MINIDINNQIFPLFEANYETYQHIFLQMKALVLLTFILVTVEMARHRNRAMLGGIGKEDRNERLVLFRNRTIRGIDKIEDRAGKILFRNRTIRGIEKMENRGFDRIIAKDGDTENEVERSDSSFYYS
jgi:hypothetical protein